ncbi:transcriptional regulator [Rhizobium sp. Root1203]|uniref:chaperone modulator CbpM n=1 Tax=Rhizobium sp. Root1203 TaxID=1736427 RepID=UPI000709C325|nr:chaperone modulator CbpM [Rhizobium sp. Root1203]KQV29702.1 transcriptional regulator [Rhizobium sp. Root1203]
MNDLELRRFLKIDVTVLDVWVEQGWLLPEANEGNREFRDADVARGRLILDLTQEMGVNEAGVDLIMDLVDQIHGLRGTLRDMLSAMEQQDDEVKRRLRGKLDALGRTRGGHRDS